MFEKATARFVFSRFIQTGTEGSGLTQFHQGRFSPYTQRDGLPPDNISGTSVDNRGNLWVLARDGVWNEAGSSLTWANGL